MEPRFNQFIMPTNITIKGIPDDVYQKLKQQAIDLIENDRKLVLASNHHSYFRNHNL